jgi:hypothetical protein
MIRIAAISFFAAVALASCGGAPIEISNDSQRAIDSDIAAARNQGPTAISQDPAQISVLPTVKVPFRNND